MPYRYYADAISTDTKVLSMPVAAGWWMWWMQRCKKLWPHLVQQQAASTHAMADEPACAAGRPMQFPGVLSIIDQSRPQDRPRLAQTIVARCDAQVPGRKAWEMWALHAARQRKGSPDPCSIIRVA